MTAPRILFLLAAATMLMTAACDREPPETVLRKAILSKLGMAYHGFNMRSNRPPADINEMASYLAVRNPAPNTSAVLLDPVRHGDVVFIWNAPLFEDGEKNDRYVLGYEKAVPESGGMMVTADGFVQLVTAAEFAALPRLPQATNAPPTTASPK
jgi:hypothetical protein